MQALLGDTLQKGSEAISTEKALAGKEVVAFYFSAHWCPPCRAFTPELARVYSQLVAAGKSFELVFVSSDREDSGFNEYYTEMPWLALPYANRDAKAALSKKFKVRGIPSLVILDGATGKTITTDGREAVASPEDFPWRPKPLSELMGTDFDNKQGTKTTLAELQKAGKYIGLYFSAHWCPPCRKFTPELVKVYNKLTSEGKPFEMVFCSSDRDQSQFDEYYGEMPWLTVPLADKARKEALSKHFGVSGIPSLVILDSNLKVVNGNARGAVGSDASGDNFPWAPKAVGDIDEDPEGIEDTPAVVVLAEEAADDWDAIEESLGAVSAEIKAGLGEEGEMPFLFFIARETGGIGSQIRRLCKLGKAGSKPDTVLLDLSDAGSFYPGPDALSVESVKAMLAGYSAKSLPGKDTVKQ